MVTTLLPAPAPPVLKRPLCISRVAAGFPSPADDYIEATLDLNEYMIEHKEATFYLRVKGDSMRDERIFDGDIITVDRSLAPHHGSIVVAVLNGELTVKKLYRRGKVVKLCAGNPEFPEIVPQDGSELVIWGVVKGVIRKF